MSPERFVKGESERTQNQRDRAFLNSNPKKSPELSISQPGDTYGSAKIHAVQVHQDRRQLLALLQTCLLFERKNQAQPLLRWRQRIRTSRWRLPSLSQEELDSSGRRCIGCTAPAECTA
jgi:hypothetical protein